MVKPPADTLKAIISIISYALTFSMAHVALIVQ